MMDGTGPADRLDGRRNGRTNGRTGGQTDRHAYAGTFFLVALVGVFRLRQKIGVIR